MGACFFLSTYVLHHSGGGTYILLSVVPSSVLYVDMRTRPSSPRPSAFRSLASRNTHQGKTASKCAPQKSYESQGLYRPCKEVSNTSIDKVLHEQSQPFPVVYLYQCIPNAIWTFKVCLVNCARSFKQCHRLFGGSILQSNVSTTTSSCSISIDLRDS